MSTLLVVLEPLSAECASSKLHITADSHAITLLSVDSVSPQDLVDLHISGEASKFYPAVLDKGMRFLRSHTSRY